MSQQPTDAFRNAKKYHQIIASGKCLNGNNIIFQHHNDPEITINAVKVYPMEHYQACNGLPKARNEGRLKIFMSEMQKYVKACI